MSYRFLLHVAVLSLIPLAMAACSGSDAPAPEAATSEVMAETPTPDAANTCMASASWFTSPSEPDEVAAAESFCDFYQFSWQWFLAQVSPADPANPEGDRVFETNRVVDPSAGPGQCAADAKTGRAMAARLISFRVAKPIDFESIQADGKPLYDQQGNILYYNMWYSAEECHATPAGFVAGTMEIKAAWRVLAASDPTYFMMDAEIPDGTATKSVTLGLVGFHLANWTSKHPEMIWATFEHKSNAPLCNGSAATSGWTLASDSAAACLANNPQPTAGPPSPACASFDFNKPPAASTSTPPPTGPADEICRLYESGNSAGTDVNGNDTAANLAAIQQLNKALVGVDGLLTTLPASDPMAVWKNYEMIGGLWTKGGAASGSPPVASKQGPANTASPQRGSLELTNMTMETYEQGPTSAVPNCFGCHNYVPDKPLGVSHIANKYLLPNTESH